MGHDERVLGFRVLGLKGWGKPERLNRLPLPMLYPVPFSNQWRLIWHFPLYTPNSMFYPVARSDLWTLRNICGVARQQLLKTYFHPHSHPSHSFMQGMILQNPGPSAVVRSIRLGFGFGV